MRALFRSTRNPLPNRKSPFLEISRAGALDCNKCRNALHWAFKGYGKKTSITKIQTSASFKAAYMLLVYAWEE